MNKIASKTNTIQHTTTQNVNKKASCELHILLCIKETAGMSHFKAEINHDTN